MTSLWDGVTSPGGRCARPSPDPYTVTLPLTHTHPKGTGKGTATRGTWDTLGTAGDTLRTAGDTLGTTAATLTTPQATTAQLDTALGPAMAPGGQRGPIRGL